MNLESEARKVKIFFVTPQFITQLFTEGNKGILEIRNGGFPADSRIIGAGFDPHRASFWLHVESETFPPVKPGTLIPEKEPSYISFDKVQ